MADLLTEITPLPAPVIFSVPGAPRGKGRHKTRVLGSKQMPSKKRPGTMVTRYITQEYKDKETAAYEAMIKAYARIAMKGRLPFDGPVHLEMVIHCPIPPSWTKKKQAAALTGELLPVTKPDGDNVLKAVKDGLNTVVYGDDKQVASFSVRKQYSPVPRLAIGIAAAGNGVPPQAGTVTACMQLIAQLHTAGMMPQQAYELLVNALENHRISIGEQAVA